MDGASALLTRPSDVTDRAIRVPEVLGCIFSWLSNDRRAFRSVRLVSRHFHAVANQSFRVHLDADYAMEHNCVQEAASIIGGLTVTLRQSIDELDEGILEVSPEEYVVNTAFFSLVAQSCVHLERLEIVLESITAPVPLILSTMFSQDRETPAVFRIKDLQLTLGSNYAQSVKYEVPRMQLPDATSNLPWATVPSYSPTKSSLAQLEKLTLQMSFLRDNADIYKVLQLKLCPEITIATSFLGPVLNLNLEKGSPVTAAPSRTFKTLECYTTGLNVDQVFRLKEQAPAFEDLQIWEIINVDKSMTASLAFLRASARQAGSLNLKKLRMVSCSGRYVNLLLGQLLNPTILESFHVDYLYPNQFSIPDVVEEDFSRILEDVMDGMRGGPLSGWSECRSMKEFVITKLNYAVSGVDWLQVLRTIPRFFRLDKITLPISVHGFVKRFVKSALTEAVPAGNEERSIGSSSSPFPLDRLPFPACSSLLSLTLHGSGSRIYESSVALQFANYLTHWLPQLRHLHIKESYFLDFSFLDAIAPLPKPSSPLIPSLQTRGQIDGDIGLENQNPTDIYSRSGGNNGYGNDSEESNSSIDKSGFGLCQLESLSVSFEFLSRTEFLDLPRSDYLLSLHEKKADLAARRMQFWRGPEGLHDYQEVEKLIRAEEQKMVLEARPIQVHEDRLDQIVAFLGRFQETRDDNGDIDGSAPAGQRVEGLSRPRVSGLKEVSFSQVGMPKQYLKKLEQKVKTLYPKLKWTSHSTIHRIPDLN